MDNEERQRAGTEPKTSAPKGDAKPKRGRKPKATSSGAASDAGGESAGSSAEATAADDRDAAANAKASKRAAPKRKAKAGPKAADTSSPAASESPAAAAEPKASAQRKRRSGKLTQAETIAGAGPAAKPASVPAEGGGRLRSVRLSDAAFAGRLLGKYGWSLGAPRGRTAIVHRDGVTGARRPPSSGMHVDVHIRNVRPVLQLYAKVLASIVPSSPHAARAVQAKPSASALIAPTARASSAVADTPRGDAASAQRSIVPVSGAVAPVSRPQPVRRTPLPLPVSERRGDSPARIIASASPQRRTAEHRIVTDVRRQWEMFRETATAVRRLETLQRDASAAIAKAAGVPVASAPSPTKSGSPDDRPASLGVPRPAAAIRSRAATTVASSPSVGRVVARAVPPSGETGSPATAEPAGVRIDRQGEAARPGNRSVSEPGHGRAVTPTSLQRSPLGGALQRLVHTKASDRTRVRVSPFASAGRPSAAPIPAQRRTLAETRGASAATGSASASPTRSAPASVSALSPTRSVAGDRPSATRATAQTPRQPAEARRTTAAAANLPKPEGSVARRTSSSPPIRPIYRLSRDTATQSLDRSVLKTIVRSLASTSGRGAVSAQGETASVRLLQRAAALSAERLQGAQTRGQAMPPRGRATASDRSDAATTPSSKSDALRRERAEAGDAKAQASPTSAYRASPTSSRAPTVLVNRIGRNAETNARVRSAAVRLGPVKNEASPDRTRNTAAAPDLSPPKRSPASAPAPRPIPRAGSGAAALAPMQRRLGAGRKLAAPVPIAAAEPAVRRAAAPLPLVARLREALGTVGAKAMRRASAVPSSPPRPMGAAAPSEPARRQPPTALAPTLLIQRRGERGAGDGRTQPAMGPERAANPGTTAAPTPSTQLARSSGMRSRALDDAERRPADRTPLVRSPASGTRFDTVRSLLPLIQRRPISMVRFESRRALGGSSPTASSGEHARRPERSNAPAGTSGNRSAAQPERSLAQRIAQRLQAPLTVRLATFAPNRPAPSASVGSIRASASAEARSGTQEPLRVGRAVWSRREPGPPGLTTVPSREVESVSQRAASGSTNVAGNRSAARAGREPLLHRAGAAVRAGTPRSTMPTRDLAGRAPRPSPAQRAMTRRSAIDVMRIEPPAPPRSASPSSGAPLAPALTARRRSSAAADAPLLQRAAPLAERDAPAAVSPGVRLVQRDAPAAAAPGRSSAGLAPQPASRPTARASALVHRAGAPAALRRGIASARVGATIGHAVSESTIAPVQRQVRGIRLDVAAKVSAPRGTPDTVVQSLQQAVKSVEKELEKAKEAFSKPSIDMGRLSDQLYRELVKRIQLDRQRRGM
ncbi:hypothetical protein MO973_12130 [Paenibacillus sp. TRM 82003]|nr:hypothetical protein [Paenibacillus sp. TRM 82003]